MQERSISTFLLCLLLAVTWHNALVHTHMEVEAGGHDIAHQHHHHHNHHVSNHTREAPEEWSFRSWIREIFGDFEHPDLGDDHLEVFLSPNYQISLGPICLAPSQTFITPPAYLLRLAEEVGGGADVSVGEMSFSDPPFLDAISNRGPPTFS